MKFGQRLRSRLWRARVEDEVDSELSFHVEMRARELVERGMSPAEAREAAIRRFGDIDRVNATCRALGKQRDHDMRRTEYFSELAQDVKFACRQLARSPGFTAVAVLTLALGIGATTAIFSAVQSVVLRPLPFPDSNRLLSVYEYVRENRSNVSAGNFVDGIEPVGAFSAVSAAQFSSFNLADGGNTERVVGARVTAGYFDVFNLPPAHGRVFSKEEDQPGREQVVVLSHRLWMRRFGGDPAVVGRRVTLNERPYDVIGVMPARFDYTADRDELWVPIAFTPQRKAMHDEHYLQVYARLKPAATSEQALQELRGNAQRLRVAFPREAAELDFTTVPVLEDLVGDYPRRMFTLLGAVGFVLLIACGNVANLLLARGAVRAGELAVRAALGAGRGRIARQLLTESVVLAILSAIAGLALAAVGIRALVAAAPPGVPRLEQTTLDPYVLGFTCVVTLVSAMLFGVVPALRAARVDVQTVIKEGGRGAGMGGVRDRLRTGLIVAELAVALLLLVGAGLLIRSSLALAGGRPGLRSVRRSLGTLRAARQRRFPIARRRSGPATARRGRRADSRRDGLGDLDQRAHGRRRQRQRPHPRERGVRPAQRHREPASDGDTGLLRHDADSDRQGPAADQRRPPGRAQGHGDQRGARPSGISRTGPHRQADRLLRVRAGRQEAGL